MIISVVMTTYNGSKYIEEQLLSILNQSVSPDEVIILDDQSTDDTQHVVNLFIKNHSLTKWRFIVNETNLGWKANFAKGINIAKGDIIFLSDQDDIWDTRKIKIMIDAFDEHRDAEVLVSNYSVFYEDKGIQKTTDTEKKYKRKMVEKVYLSGKTFETFRPGCTMAFKRSIIELFNKCWNYECAHDMIVWDVGLLRGKTYIINASLICQRRHANVSTPENNHNRRRRLDIIDSHIKLIDIYQENLALNEDTQIWLKNYKSYLCKRRDAVSKGSTVLLFSLLKYITLYPGIKSWFGDIISSKKG